MNAPAPKESPSTDPRASLERDLESFRTYLLYVAGRFKGDRFVGGERTSDLVQRTMHAAMEKIRAGNIPEGDEAHRRRWMRRVLRHIWIDLLRKEARAPGLISDVDEWLADSSASPSAKAVNAERIGLVVDAIKRLGPQERQILLWRHRDDLSAEQIGKRLNFSESYVNRILRATRTKILAQMDSSSGIGAARLAGSIEEIAQL